MVQKLKQILQPVRVMDRRAHGVSGYQPVPPPNFVPRTDPSYYFLIRR